MKRLKLKEVRALPGTGYWMGVRAWGKPEASVLGAIREDSLVLSSGCC